MYEQITAQSEGARNYRQQYDYLYLHVRMEKAKRMLSSNDLPIGDIAMQCGFEDAGYFGRVFKQTFGMTPSQYRKKPHLD